MTVKDQPVGECKNMRYKYSMPILHSSIYAIAIGLCVFSILLIQHGKADVPARFFVAFLVVQALGFVFEWLMIHPDLPLTMLWLFGLMTLSLFVSPLAWAFAQDISSEKLDLRLKRLAPHLLVVILGVALLLPLFATLFPSSPITQLRWPGDSGYSIVHITMLLTAGVFLAQSAYYIRLCLSLFDERVEQNKGLFTEVSDLGSNTLRILVVAVIANCAVSTLRVLYCWTMDETPLLNIVLAVLQMACLGYVAYAVLRQAFASTADLNSERKAIFANSNTKQKYQNSGLGRDKHRQIISQLADLLTAEHIHRDNNINLSMLCERLDESPQDVSQAINQSEYQSFYHMIHQHRIADAQSLLLSRPELSILNIAYEVGYNSKSTFNNAFKKFASCSPSEYRNHGVGALSSGHLSA